MTDGQGHEFFDYIDRKRREKEVLEGQIARLEKLQQGVSCWSNVWGIFGKKIKALQIELAYLEQEIQEFTDSYN